MSDPRDRALPRRLGPYELRSKIAEGGMAEVYVASPMRGGPAVAVKTIREELGRSPEFRQMFLDEGRLVATLAHANIVAYEAFGEDGGQLYLAMELLSGHSLWSVWEACRRRNVRLRYDMIAWVGARVADGLQHAHERADERGVPLGIVHRDVNAANVFVTHDGCVKVLDFGLAKAANRIASTAAGTVKGKVAYMSPEQAAGGEIDRRTDVFALGTTLWELACDRRLFKEEDDLETLRRIRAAVVPDPTQIVDGFPPALGGILRRALARDRDRRFSTAGELARELDAFVHESGSAVTERTIAQALAALFDPRDTDAAPAGTERSSRSPAAPAKRPARAMRREGLPLVLLFGAFALAVAAAVVALRCG